MKISLILFLVILSFLMMYIFISADRGKLPQFIATLYDFPFGDKIGHLLLMGGFTFLVQLCMFSNKRTMSHNKNILLIIALIIGILITVEELTQLFFATRSFSMVDLTSSYLGILLFSMINLQILKYRQRNVSLNKFDSVI